MPHLYWCIPHVPRSLIGRRQHHSLILFQSDHRIHQGCRLVAILHPQFTRQTALLLGNLNKQGGANRFGSQSVPC
ncbi:MAG: hypothetical protein LH660_10610, partial [Phormidesmis sp. CAN_BIN36]|nr:hypothetical protein [Phormidesmis sp. CAN_BIN36]